MTCFRTLLWQGAPSRGLTWFLLLLLVVYDRTYTSVVWYYSAVFLIGFLIWFSYPLNRISHSWPFYCSLSLASFWCQYANQRTCWNSIKFLQNQVQSFPGEIPYIVDIKVSHNLLKVVLAEMFIVALDNTNINIYTFD